MNWTIWWSYSPSPGTTIDSMGYFHSEHERAGLARGLSRQTDFDDGITRQLADDFESEAIYWAKRRKSVLDRSEQSSLDIHDMDAVSDRPTYQGYVDSIAAELDANGNVRR